MKKINSNPIVAIIPARYGSTRFPGKPLVSIQGKTLIQRTYENTQQTSMIDEVYVATDDKRIYNHIKEFGGNVIMTPTDCPTGTDRLAFVVNSRPDLKSAEFIVNIQGDEPCLDPDVIPAMIKALQHAGANVSMATAITKFENQEEAMNPNEVKCVIDLEGYALYFSRTLIPGNLIQNFDNKISYYKHVGIYAFRPDFLVKYATLPKTPLQCAEDLEQLKVLEHGYKIITAFIKNGSVGVNTPEDIKKVEQELCKQNTFL